MRWRLALLLGVAVFASPPASRAGFDLRLEVDGGGVGNFVNVSGAGGTVSFSGPLGVFTSNVVIGNGPPVALQTDGVDLIASMDLMDFTVRSTGTGTHNLRLILVDDSFTNPFPAGIKAELRTNIAANVIFGSGQFSYQGWLDNANGNPLEPAPGAGAVLVPPAGTVANPAAGPVVLKASGFSSSSTVLNLASTYSLGLVVDITLNGIGEVSLDAMDQVHAPAPAGLVLAVSALPVLGVGYLRRRLRHGR
jgi:hypothetical protein